MQNLKERIKDLDIKGKNVLIIGFPASGKTTLAELLNSENHTLIHSDDYMQFGFKESLYELLKDLENIEGNTIIEGVMGYRLLRKGVELNSYYPDVVLELKVTEATVRRRYLDRDTKKLNGALSMCKSCTKILGDYEKLTNTRAPIWIKILND